MATKQISTRADALEVLQNKPWFKASGPLIKTTVQTLPPKFDGYLMDLASRPDGNIGNLEVLRISHVLPANFGVFTIFEVRSPEGNIYEYEYHSWNRGPISGAKGLIRLLDKSGNVTHIVILRASKFATAGDEFDVAGGFREGVDTNPEAVLTGFLRELKEELGTKDEPAVLAVHKLGRLKVDAGQTNNHPYIFAADLSNQILSKLGELPNPDEWELDTGPFIVPIEQIRDLVDKDDDGYFLSIVSRMVVKGLIPLWVLVNDEAGKTILRFHDEHPASSKKLAEAYALLSK